MDNLIQKLRTEKPLFYIISASSVSAVIFIIAIYDIAGIIEREGMGVLVLIPVVFIVFLVAFTFGFISKRDDTNE